MSLSSPTYSHEETLRLLAEKAKVSGDRFMVKVNRRRGAAGLFEHQATLVEASVEQIANPETWLPLLCGGGEYGLRVSHMDDVPSPIGGVLVFKFVGTPFDSPRSSLVGKANWQGPGTIIFPAVEVNANANGASAGAVMSGPPLPMTQGYGPTGIPPPPVPMPPAFYDERHEREKERVAREARDLAETKAKVERQMAEREFEVRQHEREAKLKDEIASKARDLESKLAAQQQGATKTPELIAALATAFGPIVAAFAESSKQSRIESMRMQEEAAKRQADMMQMMAAQQQQSTQLMVQLLTKDKGPDPMVTMALETMRANSTGNAEMMTRIVDAMGTVSKTSVGMIEAIADLRLGGEPENPILGAVRETVKALATLSKGAESGARKQVQAQAQQKQLPAKNPAAPAPTPKVPAPQAKNGTAPAQVHVFEAPNAPTPNVPPVSEVPASFDGVEAAPAPGRFQPVEGHVIEQLKAMIESYHEPVEEVAQFFVDSLRTEELKAALTEHEGDVNSLVAQHLGLWVMSDEKNRVYIGRVGEAIDKLGSQLGLVEEPEGDDEQDESSEG